MEALLVDNLISEWLDYLTKTCRFHKTLPQLIPKQTLYFYIPMPLAVPDSFWIYSLVISFALGSFKPTAEMKSHLPLNFVFQFKSASNQCSSQWIYEFIFSVSSCFLFTNTSHYTSTATRDGTVLASWVCLLMRAFIAVANLCSTELLGFFWNFTYY